MSGKPLKESYKKGFLKVYKVLGSYFIVSLNARDQLTHFMWSDIRVRVS